MKNNRLPVVLSVLLLIASVAVIALKTGESPVPIAAAPAPVGQYSATVIRVVDGDTVDVLIDIGLNTLRRDRVRLDGIDAPEIRGKTQAERDAAKRAKEYLIGLLPANSTVTLSGIGNDKYGRVLATVLANGKDVCQQMIESKHAVEYHGEKKQEFEE